MVIFLCIYWFQLNHNTMVYYIMSCHVVSYHIISYHIISYHIISYHIISYVSYHLISSMNHNTIVYYIMSGRLISYVMSCHVIYHIIYHIMSYTAYRRLWESCFSSQTSADKELQEYNPGKGNTNGAHTWYWIIAWVTAMSWFCVFVRRAGLIWSQQDFEWWWSVPLSSASLY